MLPFTATGWVRTPVNRSPGRAVSLESFSLMRTLMGVPAGMPGKGDACASDAQTIIAYRANRIFPVRLLMDGAFLPSARDDVASWSGLSDVFAECTLQRVRKQWGTTAESTCTADVRRF